MFTVKQTDAVGNVRLIECEHVAVKIEHSMLVLFMVSPDGRRLAPLTGWPSDDRKEDMLYIMNSNGATISAHRFRPSAAATMQHGGHVGPYPAWVSLVPEDEIVGGDSSGMASNDSALCGAAQAA